MHSPNTPAHKPAHKAVRTSVRSSVAARLAASARSSHARKVAATAAVAAALALVGGGVVSAAEAPVAASTAESSAAGAATVLRADAGSSAAASTDRTGDVSVSRSGERAPVAATSTPAAADSIAAAKKKQAKAARAAHKGAVATARMRDKNPRSIAKAMLADFGFGAGEFSCLNDLWVGESNWRWNADNPSSSAYGIPQALPGSKMSSAGSDWKTNPATQIKWGLGYIKDVYGSPCAAQSFKSGAGWY